MGSNVFRLLLVTVTISAMGCASGGAEKQTTLPPEPPPPPAESEPVTTEQIEPTLLTEEVPTEEVPTEEVPEVPIDRTPADVDQADVAPTDEIPDNDALAEEVSAAPEPQRTTEEIAAEDDSLIILPSVNPARRSPVTLAEAAAAERERRQIADAPIAVITNKNLEEYATGELTIMGVVRTPEEPEAKEAGDGEDVKDETYWRTRARTIREEWREAVDVIEELEGDAAELRVRFYAEDDGFYRDSQIKPAWDRALMDLDGARRRVVEKRQELKAFQQEGRQAGALPGWLREGIELEPEPEPRQTEKIHVVGEPVVVDEGGNGR